MSSAASCQLKISDRRDQMILTMAVDAARAKDKSHEARQRKERQVAYRGVRYQRFNGRREDVMKEEVREAKRARRAKSLQRTERWSEAQGCADAEEGSPRVDRNAEDQEDMPLILLAVQLPSVVAPVEIEESVVSPGRRNQTSITSFFVIRKGSVVV